LWGKWEQAPPTREHCFVLFFVFVFVTPEGFTIVVANEGLEKARAYLNQAYLNQVPRTDSFTSPPKEGAV